MKSKQKFSTIAIFGYFFGITIGAFLFYAKDLLWLPYISITITIVVAFFIFAFATKIISGAENFVLYRHMLFSIACVSVILSLMQIPLLPYLDVYIVGFGFFHLFGRIGCYKAGCCHGRPSVFGVKYNESYRSQGFPEYLINVILFPVQIIEAIGIAFITLYCICLFFADLYVPGSILSWYFILYSSLRFILEFFRGDADRKYWRRNRDSSHRTHLYPFYISGHPETKPSVHRRFELFSSGHPETKILMYRWSTVGSYGLNKLKNMPRFPFPYLTFFDTFYVIKEVRYSN